MKTENIEGLSLFEINLLIQQGARFVTFSNLNNNLKDSTIYFIRPGEKAFKYALKHFLRNLSNSWRKIPLRPFYISKSLFYLAIGGKDYTHSLLADFNRINPVDNPNLDCLQYL